MADIHSSDLAQSVASFVDRRIDETAADAGMGTVTALAPGGTAGTVAVDTGSGTSIKMRRNSAYSPVVADKVWWSRSRSGDYFVHGKLA